MTNRAFLRISLLVCLAATACQESNTVAGPSPTGPTPTPTPTLTTHRYRRRLDRRLPGRPDEMPELQLRRRHRELHGKRNGAQRQPHRHGFNLPHRRALAGRPKRKHLFGHGLAARLHRHRERAFRRAGSHRRGVSRSRTARAASRAERRSSIGRRVHPRSLSSSASGLHRRQLRR